MYGEQSEAGYPEELASCKKPVAIDDVIICYNELRHLIDISLLAKFSDVFRL